MGDEKSTNKFTYKWRVKDMTWYGMRHVIYQEGRNRTLSERGDLILISNVKGEKGRGRG